MADVTRQKHSSGYIPRKFKDMADGTWAEVVAAQVIGSSLPDLATTATVTSVNDSAASQQLLAANAARRGFRIVNDSTEVLYVKYGTTASTTSFSAKLQPSDMLFEDHYGGRVDGIWAADAAGAARITELS